MARTTSPKNATANPRPSARRSPRKLTNGSVRSSTQKSPGRTSPQKSRSRVARPNPRNPVNVAVDTSKRGKPRHCRKCDGNPLITSSDCKHSKVYMDLVRNFIMIFSFSTGGQLDHLLKFDLFVFQFRILEKQGIKLFHGISFPDLQALRDNNTPATASNGQRSESAVASILAGNPNLPHAAPNLLPSSRGVQAYGIPPFGPDSPFVSRSPEVSSPQWPPPTQASIFVDISGHGLRPQTPLRRNEDDMAFVSRPPNDSFQIDANPLAFTDLDSVPNLDAGIPAHSPLLPSTPSSSTPTFESHSVANLDQHLLPLPPSSPPTVSSIVSPQSSPSKPKRTSRPSQKHAIHGRVQGAFRGSRQWGKEEFYLCVIIC
ncbi:hypothetical protein GYMLUDRAFT_59151 [Collybiopsis luxurians FD-317 M1]|uniref:Uncharacterized protein n=1 Tax=Collybiopsis luxurians FD-317 M1 TaxID=944289 RepID=A0A0D0BZB6_9AGAR|nr:hypothetical protein GYMLUDRAFT_59151 [Collybiopsis luxurians FD-317 M1]